MSLPDDSMPAVDLTQVCYVCCENVLVCDCTYGYASSPFNNSGHSGSLLAIADGDSDIDIEGGIGRTSVENLMRWACTDFERTLQ